MGGWRTSDSCLVDERMDVATAKDESGKRDAWASTPTKGHDRQALSNCHSTYSVGEWY